jgi:predicted phage tail protein
MRPEFAPVLETWEQEVDGRCRAAQPDSRQRGLHRCAVRGCERAAEQSAVEASARAADAGSNAEAYLLTTLFMASALFFAGVVSSFESAGPRIVLLTMSMVMLAAGAARIVELPIG